jgi:hypothetical protein
VRRIGRVPAGLAWYALTGTWLCAAGLHAGGPWWATALVMTLHGADFTGRVIAGHLRGIKRPLPDWVAPAVVTACAAVGGPAAICGVAAGGYLAVRAVGSTAGMFKVFGRHWRWRNRPAPVEASVV